LRLSTGPSTRRTVSSRRQRGPAWPHRTRDGPAYRANPAGHADTDRSDRAVPRGTPAEGGDNVDLPLEEPHLQPPWATVMIAESVDCGFRSATCANTFGDHGAGPPPHHHLRHYLFQGVLRLVTNRGGLAGWGGGVELADVTWSPELSAGAVRASRDQHPATSLVPPWPLCHGFLLAWYPPWLDTLTPALNRQNA
jgi:hypothetical protein